MTRARTFKLTFESSGVVVPCHEDVTALSAMGLAGRDCVTVGCRNGGCGVCRVQVIEGEYECGLMSREQVSEDDQSRGIALACRLYPRSDLRLRPIGKLATKFDARTADLIRCLTAPIARIGQEQLA